jgi:hypothetical protein
MPVNKSWHDYIESLIERGRVIIDIGFLKSWNNEVKKMNEGKVELHLNTHTVTSIF